MFGLVDDSEFTEKRDQFAVDCDSGGSIISRWKVGERFQSQWRQLEHNPVGLNRKSTGWDSQRVADLRVSSD